MYTKNLIDRYSRSFPWRTEVFYRKIGIICARDFKGPPLRSTVVGPTPAPTLYQRIDMFPLSFGLSPLPNRPGNVVYDRTLIFANNRQPF